MTIFLSPAIPEIINVGIYSLKNTLFNIATIITSILYLLINSSFNLFALSTLSLLQK